MSRTAPPPDRDDDQAPLLPPHGHAAPPAGPHEVFAPCTRCNTPTQRSTLAHYGARCLRCYIAFCREPQPTPRFMGDKRTGGNRAWAYALKARQDAGERLPVASQEMLKNALRGVDLYGPEDHQP